MTINTVSSGFWLPGSDCLPECFCGVISQSFWIPDYWFREWRERTFQGFIPLI